MLRLTRKQMSCLGTYAEDRFRERLAAFWRESLDALDCPPARDLDDLVREQVACARAHELCSEREIACFVGLALLHGSGFDRRAGQAKEILDSFKTASDEKLSLLKQWSDSHRAERLRGSDLRWD
jgi:hypothetical protein